MRLIVWIHFNWSLGLALACKLPWLPCMLRDRQSMMLLILLDIPETFDIIVHSILLEHLSELEVGGTTLQWFQSYVDGHLQRLVLGDVV